MTGRGLCPIIYLAFRVTQKSSEVLMGHRSKYEVWLSLVERLVWDQEAAGSNPVTSIYMRV